MATQEELEARFRELMDQASQVGPAQQRISTLLGILLNLQAQIAALKASRTLPCTWPEEDYEFHLTHPALWMPAPVQEPK